MGKGSVRAALRAPEERDAWSSVGGPLRVTDEAEYALI